MLLCNVPNHTGQKRSHYVLYFSVAVVRVLSKYRDFACFKFMLCVCYVAVIKADKVITMLLRRLICTHRVRQVSCYILPYHVQNVKYILFAEYIQFFISIMPITVLFVCIKTDKKYNNSKDWDIPTFRQLTVPNYCQASSTSFDVAVEIIQLSQRLCLVPITSNNKQ